VMRKAAQRLRTFCLIALLAKGGVAVAQPEPAERSECPLSTAPCPVPAQAEQEQTQQQTGPAAGDPANQTKKRNFFKNIWDDQKAIWMAPAHSKNYRLRVMIPFGLATAGLIASDKHVARELTEGPPGNGVKVSRSISYAGTSYALFGFAGGLYAVGRLNHNDGPRQTGLLALQALVDSTIVVESLKAMTQRERPTQGSEQERLDDATGRFGAGGDSFPSGHAINSFALASVMAARYPDRPLIKYGAYGLATAVSVSRVTSRRHFPSDVVVGGALGYLIGHYVARARPDGKRSPIQPMICPLADRSSRQYGLSLQFKF
jgi:membrane-associated phospholipid phosphatase